ncbi:MULTISPECIES: DUF4261 domain-containing protein [Achromobacter]|uniref:Membrane protein n=1 Tax=Achromobacter spanius TaxID=217203 RepID=A0AAW3HVW0_9BURK|nr:MULTISPECIES: DUF4261 domain-containing protein [Achromobacter]AZS77243.1 DUF4261 domain-containing protein [Achromobacter spanius]KNE23764.1 membrane protein [Achromobacter spanius]MCD0498424.1 DUF4261 domain-containing protein [Achromobacter sp. MY14]MCW3151520.1 DUF4261 domain-containing protein [Achromobacter spanius]
MSIFSRFFGRKEESADARALAANPAIENPLSLQVLFAAPLALNEDTLKAALSAYHPSMSEARVEIAPDMPEVLGLAGWGEHVVRLVGFDAPYPKDSLEACVAPAHYPGTVKDEVRAHASHIILYYAGFEKDPLEQYVALAAVAGALTGFGAVAVLNEHAHTSLPAGVFDAESLGEESLDLLRTLPLTMLYCGFVKYEVEGVAGVWMRTYGADCFGLPDFAALARGHDEGEYYSNMFNNIMGYMLESGAELAAGHTMQIGENAYMKLREPAQEEYFLDGPAQVLVAEIITADEINAPQ